MGRAEVSPTARALLTLELLQTTPGITAERLALRLGVSQRAVRRYVGILREAGIPVESVRGPYGGYTVGRGVRLPPLVFTSEEALGLVMAVLDGHHAAGDPSDPVGSAVGKIMRGLPEPVAAQAEAVRRGTAPAPDRGGARPDPATTTALVEACAARLAVRIDYRSEVGTRRHIDVDPWGVVVRHGRWYLLCRQHAADALRAYRVDRVLSVEVLDATVETPADLDPVALLEEHLASGWEHEVEVVVEASSELVGRWLPRAFGRLEAVGESATRLVATTSNPRWYAAQLAELPAPYRVVGGPELRAAVALVADRARAAVEDRG